MAAKELTFFFPEDFEKELAMANLVDKLGLEIINIPEGIELTFEFSAKRGEGKSYLAIEYVNNAKQIIEEIGSWENPSSKYKHLILSCHSSMTLYYRNINDARQVILILAPPLSSISSQCIVENGNGCLLLLSDIFLCLQKDETWSWEREYFPELPDVAISEWSAPD